MSQRVQPVELVIDRVRQPGQRMPVGGVTRGKRPPDRLPSQAAYVSVGGDVLAIVQHEKAVAQHRRVDGKRHGRESGAQQQREPVTAQSATRRCCRPPGTALRFNSIPGSGFIGGFGASHCVRRLYTAGPTSIAVGPCRGRRSSAGLWPAFLSFNRAHWPVGSPCRPPMARRHVSAGYLPAQSASLIVVPRLEKPAQARPFAPSKKSSDKTKVVIDCEPFE